MVLQNFKTEFTVNYSTDFKNIDNQSKRICKVLKFSSQLSFDEVLTKISRIQKTDFPCLFIFVIETKIFNQLEIRGNHFTLFDEKRPIIVQITSENGMHTKWLYRKANENNFVNLDYNDCKEDHSDYKDLSAILCSFTSQNNETFMQLQDQLIEKYPNIKNSSTILRFLKALYVSDETLLKLIIKCALSGSKSDLLALLEASFEDDGRMLSIDAQNILNASFEHNDTEMSVLSQAVENPNKEVIDYLISNCTHLIQELPFEHRIHVSNSAMNLEKIDILCDLLEFSDFPFPSNLKEPSVTDQRLLKIINERKEFQNAIKEKVYDKVEAFAIKNWSLKLVYSIDNKSALQCAAESKNFDAFVKLKSLGFKAHEFRCIDDIECLTHKEIIKLNQKASYQTKINAKHAHLDSEKSVHLLRTRSYIHNRMINKNYETTYRGKIHKWLEDIYKIPLCSKFLDAASQCEDLKIIFDFQSESVSKVVLVLIQNMNKFLNSVLCLVFFHVNFR